MKNRHGGITVIDLLVVLAMLVLLAAIGLPLSVKDREESRKTFMTTNKATITTNSIGGVVILDSEVVIDDLLAVKVLLDDQKVVAGFASTNVPSGTRVFAHVINVEEKWGYHKVIYWFKPTQSTNVASK